ncbi:MAG: hypothetical protein II135_07330, partial [Clostridia bacterium]|nr:hypothetical protein [Clostridia bacterium]
MKAGQGVSSFAEWIAINKNGEFVSLPEPDGARRMIEKVTLDKSSNDPGAVKVNAYVWNDSEKTYETKEFACSLSECRKVDCVSYYKFRTNKTYGYTEYVEDTVITDDTPADKLTMYFTNPAYPGATLVRLQSNGELYPFLVLGPDYGKVTWNGSEANIYTAELYALAGKGDEVRKQSVAAVISGGAVALGGAETFPFKMHNVYVLDYYSEYPKVCYGMSDGEIKLAAAGSGDFLTRDNSAYFMCKIFEKADKYDGRFVRVFDWQGNEYELPVTEEMKAYIGKNSKYGYYGFKDIDFDHESGDPDSIVITFNNGVIRANLRDAVQIDPENAKSYSAVYTERSKAEKVYSGKRVIFASQNVYPFYTAEKELFTLDWNGKTAAGYEGRYVELVNGKTRETECYFISCGEKVLRFAKQGKFYALGKLAVYEDAARSVGTVVTGCGEYFTRYMFDNIYTDANSDVVLLYDSVKLTDGIRPYWMALDIQGNVRSLPLGDNDMLWKLNKIEFDTQSSVGGTVKVTPFIRRMFWANLKYTNAYDGEPFSANLNDTHVVEYEEYYTPDPVDRWDY